MANLEQEKEMLVKWAQESLEKKYCLGKSDERESYYVVRDPKKEGYLCAYDFETLPELQQILDELWRGDVNILKIEKAVLVSAKKGKCTIRKEMQENGKQSELKEYIYNF